MARGIMKYILIIISSLSGPPEKIATFDHLSDCRIMQKVFVERNIDDYVIMCLRTPPPPPTLMDETT